MAICEKPCENCGETFTPKSNAQKVCEKEECQKWLYNTRMNTHREKKRQIEQKIKILSAIKENESVTIHNIRDITKLKIWPIRRQLEELGKRCEIDQMGEFYTAYTYKNEIPLKPYIFYLDSHRIEIPPSHAYFDYFPEFLKAEELSIDKGNVIGHQNIDLREALLRCNRAYACIWSNLLSFRLWDRLCMEKENESHINFFLHVFDRLCGPHILASKRFLDSKSSNEDDQRRDIPWYGSTFCHALTAAYIHIQIQNSKKGVINLFKRGDIRSNKYDGDYRIILWDDVADIQRRIYEHLKPQIDASYSDFQKRSGEMDKEEREFYTSEYKDLKELLEELRSYSNDKLVCKSICHAIRKTIDFHGEPFLPIEQIQ